MSFEQKVHNIGGMAFIFIFIIVVFLIFALSFPIASRSARDITNSVQAIKLNNPADTTENLTAQVESTTNTFNNTIQSWGWMPYTLLIFGIIMFMILGFNVKSHPSLMFVWIGIMVLMTFISLIFANAYESTLANGGVLYATQDNFTDFLARNLPFVVGGIGLIGGVIMFLLIPKEPEYEVVTQE